MLASWTSTIADFKAHLRAPHSHHDERRSVLADTDHARQGAAPLILIDGHHRQEELSDTEVEVEVLDVNDEEAATLLMAIDPLATLANYDVATLATLQEATRTGVHPRSCGGCVLPTRRVSEAICPEPRLRIGLVFPALCSQLRGYTPRTDAVRHLKQHVECASARTKRSLERQRKKLRSLESTPDEQRKDHATP